jgi:hypothetical protein
LRARGAGADGGAARVVRAWLVRSRA